MNVHDRIRWRANTARRFPAVWGASLALAAMASGCAMSYRTPGPGASFRSLGVTDEDVEQGTDFAIGRRLERKPLAAFPAHIAIVRVQGGGYYSHSSRSYGRGNFSVVTTRDVESDAAFECLAALPAIRGLAPLNRLVISEYLNDEEDLRQAAASVQADMLLIYTFDTVFDVEEKIAPLSFVTLGLFPDDEARVTSTVSAALLDTRNGYVYGLAEATSHQTQLANNWTSRAAVDQSRRRAEQEAFDRLVENLAVMWDRVVREYAPAEGTVAAG